jgi:acyl-CoA reductase-like NAD-dependent aldehyde dehydrogenase
MASAPTFGYLLDGEWVEQGPPLEVRSPYDHSLVATVARPGREQIESAIAAAVRAFAVTGRMPPYERQAVLAKVGRGLVDRREEFARTIALEAGKPIRTARAEVDRAIFTFTIAAEESTRIYGEWLPLDLQPATTGRWAIVRRFPLGPIAAITPFNFPLNLVAHKWAPAIAAGCTIVHKPASQTPVSSLLLARLVEESGWPAGALSVLPVSGGDAERLVSDDRLKKLTFTGSGPVGWDLKAKAGKKKVTLELGGNAGVIIHSDADLEYAAERCAFGGFTYAGQSCISVQRIYIQKAVFQRFLDLFVPKVRKLKTGDPLDEATDIGPMISRNDADRTLAWIEEAASQGATVLCGGQRADETHPEVIQPTVLAHTRPEMRVNCQEVFAPVVTVEAYEEFGEAIRLVNSSTYGLQAGIFARDAKLLFQAYQDLEVGGVIAGDVPTFRIDNMPYGGVKDSGLGREGVRYAIEEMTERKLLVMNLG